MCVIWRNLYHKIQLNNWLWWVRTLMKMYNNNSLYQYSHTHPPMCVWRMKGRKEKSHRQNGKAVLNQYGFFCVSVFVRVKHYSKVECLRLLIEERRSYRLPYAGAGGRRQEEEEEAIQQKKRVWLKHRFADEYDRSVSSLEEPLGSWGLKI